MGFRKYGNVYYTVEIISPKNDIAEIAERYKVTPTAIMKMNRDVVLRNGAIIDIPKSFKVILVDRELKEIAKEYRITVKELLRINEKARTEIKIGSPLYVPMKE